MSIVQLHRRVPGMRRAASVAVKRTIDRALCRLLDRTVRLAARPVLRTVLGHWPSRAQLHGFRCAHAAGGHLPPLLHALASIEGARRVLTATTLEAWSPQGVAGSGAAVLLTGRPRAAFLHLEKTAGSSVQEFLLQQYHPAQVAQRPPDGATAAGILMRDPAARGCALIHGHYDLPFLRGFDPQRLVFTFLREPRARILSLYYYWRSSRPSSDGGEINPAAVAAARLTLLAFLRCDMVEVRNSIDNVYVRRLIGAGAGMHDHPERALGEALTALDTLAFVGITERLTESLRLLAARLQLIPPASAPRINVGADNVSIARRDFRPVARETVTPEIEAELARLTCLDDAVYRAGLCRFDAEHELAERCGAQSLP